MYKTVIRHLSNSEAPGCCGVWRLLEAAGSTLERTLEGIFSIAVHLKMPRLMVIPRVKPC